MLDLPSMQTRQKVEQVKAYTYFSAVENPRNPPQEAVKGTKGCRLGRDKSWVGQAEDSILQVCQLTEPKKTKDWERYRNRFRLLWRHFCHRIWERAVENGQQAKRIQRSNFSFKKRANGKPS